MFKSADDVTKALADLPSANNEWREDARLRQSTLTKPAGSLGLLENLSIFLAGWSGAETLQAECMKCVVFAGNHGVTKQGISPFPSSVTVQMVRNFSNQGAAINAITSANGVELEVHALSLDQPTEDITQASAMTTEQTLHAMSLGATAVSEGLDVLAVGEMGIGNSTIAAALSAASFGGQGRDWAGPGTGLSAQGISHKAKVIDNALARHRSTVKQVGNVKTDDSSLFEPGRAFEVIRDLGGRELAAIAGAVIAARLQRKPVILDGFITTAAVAPLYRENPEIVGHLIAGHVSAEPAHRKLLERMELEPLLDLGLRLGEGTGAALACAIVRSAVATHNQMATFGEAQVSNKEQVSNNKKTDALAGSGPTSSQEKA